jgi:hypothetical protein
LRSSLSLSHSFRSRFAKEIAAVAFTKSSGLSSA